MIKIEEPALVLNDIGVPGHIHVSRSILVRPDDSRENLLGAIATVAAGLPYGRLKSLVLNSHGLPGYLIMGQGFWRPHVGLFDMLEGCVNNIFVTACEIAARGIGPHDHVAADFKGDGEPGDGYMFCRELAQRSKANVVASENDQVAPNQKIP